MDRQPIGYCTMWRCRCNTQTGGHLENLCLCRNAAVNNLRANGGANCTEDVHTPTAVCMCTAVYGQMHASYSSVDVPA
jgi:hypothetical protein